MNRIQPNLSMQYNDEYGDIAKRVAAECDRAERGEKVDMAKTAQTLSTLVQAMEREGREIRPGSAREVVESHLIHKAALEGLKARVNELSLRTQKEKDKWPSWVKPVAYIALSVASVATLAFIASKMGSPTIKPSVPNLNNMPPLRAHRFSLCEHVDALKYCPLNHIKEKLGSTLIQKKCISDSPEASNRGPQRTTDSTPSRFPYYSTPQKTQAPSYPASSSNAKAMGPNFVSELTPNLPPLEMSVQSPYPLVEPPFNKPPIPPIPNLNNTCLPRAASFHLFKQTNSLIDSCPQTTNSSTPSRLPYYSAPQQTLASAPTQALSYPASSSNAKAVKPNSSSELTPSPAPLEISVQSPSPSVESPSISPQAKDTTPLLLATPFPDTSSTENLGQNSPVVATNDAQEIFDCQLVEDCLDPPCPDIEKQNIHSTALLVEDLPIIPDHSLFNFGPYHSSDWQMIKELHRFRRDDPREKVLITAPEDPDNSFFSLLSSSELTHTHDVRLQIMKSYLDICKAVEHSRKLGNLSKVFIFGDEKEIVSDLSDLDLASCFSAMSPKGSVHFIFGNANERVIEQSLVPIAIKIANLAKLRVTTYHTRVLHSRFRWLPGTKTEEMRYRIHPKFQSCSPVDKTEAHRREIALSEFIEMDLNPLDTNLDQNPTPLNILIHDLKEDPSLLRLISDGNNHLSLCSDDPKEKVLYFSPLYDPNPTGLTDRPGGLNRLSDYPFHSLVAKTFDVQHKVIRSLEEICSTVKSGAKFGKIAAVILEVQLSPEGAFILSKNKNGTENQITPLTNFMGCFDEMEKDGRIALLGDSLDLGKDAGNENNIARRLADQSQRTVITPVCLTAKSKIKITQDKPLNLFQSIAEDTGLLTGLLGNDCPRIYTNRFILVSPREC